MAASSAAFDVTARHLLARHLKCLSSLCGLPLSGRKPELITRLAAAAAADDNVPAKPVVLSIDVGIRNLAYSLLTPVSPKANVKPKKTSSSTPQTKYIGTSPPVVKLHAWRRLSLLDDAATNGSSQVGSEDDALEVDTSSTRDFSPEALAKTANDFLQNTVLQLKPLPTHILIERQRWRSSGSPAIQEWTLRVNTIEAMLHASLGTLRDVQKWKGEVVTVRPERVVKLFLHPPNLDTPRQSKKAVQKGEADASACEPGTRPRKTSTEVKKLKINLLRDWLHRQDVVVEPGNRDAGNMIAAYRDGGKAVRRGGRSKRAASETQTEEEQVLLGSKLDDLCDSLLQGLAWLRWQENMALLRQEGGADQLLKAADAY